LFWQLCAVALKNHSVLPVVGMEHWQGLEKSLHFYFSQGGFAGEFLVFAKSSLVC